jgi:2-keto-4-pentenoate hydratase/2-oxohepta-3-ene-1,7-dioic acid hydratase in catechol pathway
LNQATHIVLLANHLSKDLTMILLQFKSGQKWHLGVKTEGGVVDVTAALSDISISQLHTGVPSSLAAFCADGSAAFEALERCVHHLLASESARRWLLGEATLSYGPCVPNPGKFICVGLNYRRHAVESGMAIPTTPVLFSKYSNTIAAPGEQVVLPTNAVEYDYEAELGVVIGKRAKSVSEQDALSYVLGYCNIDDLSARDLQFRTSQWLLGKTLDKFSPIGPYLVTADEVGNPQTMDVRCWVNGALRQNSNTADMIFNVAQLVSYISQYMTLEPGDVISTGTPEGVVFGMKEKQWLKPGDEVTIEIAGLGRLTNTMIAPTD